MFIVKYYIVGAILAFISLLLSTELYFKVIWAWIGLSLTLVSLAYVFEKKNQRQYSFLYSLAFYSVSTGVTAI